MGSCYLSSEIKGVPISKTPGCPKGFYCPEAFRRRIASEVCPSTIECTLLRLSGGTCEAQGFLEPVLCPPGSLCKDGLTKARCPEGHFCPSGTHEARACGPLSTCGAGSTAPTNFLGLATCGVIDLILILALFYSIRARSTRALRYMVQHRWHSGKSAPGNIILPKRSRVKSRIKSTILRKPAASAIIDTNFDEDTFVVVSNLNVSGEVNSGDMEEYLESLDDPEKDSEAILNRIRNSTKENKDLELSDVDTQHQPADSRDESFSDLEQMYGKFLGPEALQADIHFSAVCLSGQGRTYGRFSGSFKSRMLTAVIGTREAYGGEFIEVLAGRRDKFSGEVKLGDRSIDPRDVQSLFGYVNRNPSFFANLSVRDNIWYSAYIRRPSNADSADIETSLRCIMDALGLSAVSDRMVTEYGGQNLDSSQRIRLAIAMELVSFPQVLFLDNPTDGMDHESALNVVKVLKELTSMGITTVGTFSQPSNQALRLFDEIAVVGSGGEIVYLGSHSEIQRYFEGLGYQFPEYTNFASEITEVASGGGLTQMRQALSPTQLATCWESYLSSMGSKRHIAYNDNTEDSKNTDAESQIGGENKRSSGWLSAVKKYLGVGKEARPGAVARHQEISTQSSSSVCWAHKTWIYLKRILYQLSNSPMQIVVELLLASLFGMVIGFAVSVRRKELLRGIHIDPLEALSSSHTYWALSLTSTAISVFVATVGSFMGADEFSKEERASGLEYQKVQHSFSAYFAAKTVVSIFKVALSSLHLASFFLFIGRQPISLSDEYSIVALQMLSAHYIASALGILWRSTADRWSHYPFTLNVFSAITPGLKPIFGNAARGNTSTYLSTNFNTWAAEAFFSRYARVYSHVYKFGSSSVFGYNTHRFPQDIMVAAAMALATRILSFAVLKFIHEKVNRLHASR